MKHCGFARRRIDGGLKVGMRWAALLVSLLLGVSARAGAPEDRAANDAINHAINAYYLATDFAKADAELQGVLDGCAGKCSPQVMARAWMYLGVVRGAGLQDLAKAKEAFVQAVTLSPAVKLDAGLATPELKTAFEEIAGSQAASDTTNPAKAGATTAPLGGMTCTPLVTQLQTHRVLPISCVSDQPATKAEVKYKEFGSTQWKLVQMGTAGGQWLGTIPCSATSLQGHLLWYVNAKDQNGEVIDNFGSQRQPILVDVVENTSEPPPSFPGQPPPARCGAVGECPEEMLGTPACPGTQAPNGKSGGKTSGDACRESTECGTGLVCQNGSCAAPRSCERDNDCPSRKCVDLLCAADDDTQAGKPEARAALNWVGLHVAADLATMSATGVCERDHYACFYDNGVRQGSLGETFEGPNTSAGDVQSGLALGTIRVLASYERLLSHGIGLEARLGVAFNGTPSSSHLSFFPAHVEARAKYWFTGGPTASSPSPYVFLGGGVAEVDAKVGVVIRQNIDGCSAGSNCQTTANVDAYKRMGAGFVSAGGGALIPLSHHLGVNLNLNAMLMLPKSGLVLEPALGVAYGF